MAFLVFYIPCPDETTAKSISERMVAQRLAACANIIPIQSMYWWDGTIQQEGEWVSIMKTRLDLETALEQAILALHPYQTPCIMRFEARANEAYEQWIAASTQEAD